MQNVGGAGGTLGATQVAKAAPDGYTLLLHHIGMSTAPSLYADLAYDPVDGLRADRPRHQRADDDRRPQGLRAEHARRSSIDYVKANADTVTYANAGIGAASHLCGMLFM